MENGERLKFYPNNMIAIIAEKPSVGMDIARVVGADTKNDGYCSGNGYMVTWALGHLVSLSLPDTYGYTRTAAEDLPMLPERIPLKVLPNTRAQFEVVRKLMNSSRIGSIIE